MCIHMFKHPTRHVYRAGPVAPVHPLTSEKLHIIPYVVSESLSGDIYIYIYTVIYSYMCIYIYIHTYTYIHTCIHISIYLSFYLSTYLSISLSLYI